MFSFDVNLLFGWLCWLNHNGHSRENPLMLDTAYDLIYSFNQINPLGSYGKWREKLWTFSGFLVDKNFFDGEPTVGEMRQWLPAFAASDDWPFNKNDAQTIRAKVVG